MVKQNLMNLVQSFTIVILAVFLCVLAVQVRDQAVSEKIHTQCLNKHENDLRRLEVKLNLLLLRTEKNEKLMLETARCLEMIAQKMGNPPKLEKILRPPMQEEFP